MSEYDKLVGKIKAAREEGLPFVTLSLDAATMILSNLFKDEDFEIGDEVEVIHPESVWFRSRGRITHFEPLANSYPISVEFGETKLRVRAMGYFNKHQLEKVAHEQEG